MADYPSFRISKLVKYTSWIVAFIVGGNAMDNLARFKWHMFPTWIYLHWPHSVIYLSWITLTTFIVIYWLGRAGCELLGDNEYIQEEEKYNELDFRRNFFYLSLATTIFLVTSCASVFGTIENAQAYFEELNGLAYWSIWIASASVVWGLIFIPAYLAGFLVFWSKVLFVGIIGFSTAHPAAKSVIRSTRLNRPDYEIEAELMDAIAGRHGSEAEVMRRIGELSPLMAWVWRLRWKKYAKEAERLDKTVAARTEADRKDAGLARGVHEMERARRARYDR